MESLISLKKKIILYATHGGPWNYIKNQLIHNYGANEELVEMIIDHIKSYNLGPENGARAQLFFNALEACIKQNNYASYDYLQIMDVSAEEKAETWLNIVTSYEIIPT